MKLRQAPSPAGPPRGHCLVALLWLSLAVAGCNGQAAAPDEAGAPETIAEDDLLTLSDPAIATMEPEGLVLLAQAAMAGVERLQAREQAISVQAAGERAGAFGWPPRQHELARLKHELAGAHAERQAMQGRAFDAVDQLVARFALSTERQRGEVIVLSAACDSVRELHAEREQLAARLAEAITPTSEQSHTTLVALRALDRARLDTLDMLVGARLTELTRRFPASQRVQQLDQEIVSPRYLELSRTLARVSATGDGAPGGVSAELATDLLAELEQLKRLYPLSSWTRQAEMKVTPLTAKRNLTQLWGLPLVVFMAALLALLVELGRCIGAFRRRPTSRATGGGGVLRPAPEDSTARRRSAGAGAGGGSSGALAGGQAPDVPPSSDAASAIDAQTLASTSSASWLAVARRGGDAQDRADAQAIALPDAVALDPANAEPSADASPILALPGGAADDGADRAAPGSGGDRQQAGSPALSSRPETSRPDTSRTPSSRDLRSLAHHRFHDLPLVKPPRRPTLAVSPRPDRQGESSARTTSASEDGAPTSPPQAHAE